jgi:hypothetical protein
LQRELAVKPGISPSPMLADSAYQVIGHASIKHGAMLVAHNVDPEIVVPRHSAIFHDPERERAVSDCPGQVRDSSTFARNDKEG